MAEYVNHDHWMPFPELVADGKGPYEIIDSRGVPGLPSNGMTDKAERVMWVPLDADGRPVARHEIAHVLWSPVTVDPKALRVPMMLLRAVEDARVNLGLQHVGLPAEFGERLSNEIVALARRDLANGAIVTFILRAVASLGTNTAGPIASLVAGDEEAIFATVRELVAETDRRLARARWGTRDPVASFARGVEIARWLAGELRKRGFPVPRDRGAVLVGCCRGIGAATGAAHRHGIGAALRGRIADGVRPGRMRISTPALCHRRENAPPAKARRRRAAAEGVQVRYIHRFVSDQCVFSRPARRDRTGGGTLLIDVSGSMSLSPDDIERMVVEVPGAALVAIYSGSDDRGELRVVARDSYRAATADLAAHGSGNVVDLPALQWLAKQPGPRVWLSDGNVTGSGDVATRAITRRCREICAQARIVHARSAAAVAKVLGRMQATGSGRGEPSEGCERRVRAALARSMQD